MKAKKHQDEEKLVIRYSEGLKRHIVEEVESGRITAKEAVRMYGVMHKRTVHRWMHQYGKLMYKTRVIRIGMKSEADRIQELEEALADAELGRRVLAAQLESYEHYVPDIKKKLSMKELKEFEKNEGKLKRLR